MSLISKLFESSRQINPSKIKNLFAGLVLSTSLSACSAANLSNFPVEIQTKIEESNYEILDCDFTAEAALELEKIPLQSGITFADNNYAAGRNLAVMVFDYLFLGLGFERKTVITDFFGYDKKTFHKRINELRNSGKIQDSEFSYTWKKMNKNPEFLKIYSESDEEVSADAYPFWVIEKLCERGFRRLMLHENVHHASALGLIDDFEFNTAWSLMEKDPKYSGLCERIDKGISDRRYSFWIDLLLIWRDLEREAELAEKMVLDGHFVPFYMQRVYRKTFRKYEYLE